MSVNTIRRLPTKLWNIEVQRFIEEIEMRKVALTGKNMFKLTRKLILAVSDVFHTKVNYYCLIISNNSFLEVSSRLRSPC